MDHEKARYIASLWQWKHPQDQQNFVRWVTNPNYTRYHIRANLTWRPTPYALVALPLCIGTIGITQLNTSKWANFRYPTKGFVLDKAPIV